MHKGRGTNQQTNNNSRLEEEIEDKKTETGVSMKEEEMTKTEAIKNKQVRKRMKGKCKGKKGTEISGKERSTRNGPSKDIQKMKKKRRKRQRGSREKQSEGSEKQKNHPSEAPRKSYLQRERDRSVGLHQHRA